MRRKMKSWKNIAFFVLVFLVTIFIRLAYWIIVGLVINAIGITRIRSELLYNAIFIIPAIASLYACLKITEKMNTYKAMKIYCIISIVVNIVFVIVNIINRNSVINNVIWIIFFCINSIVECNKELK